jgi:signal transduction histidine kinase
MIKNIIFISFFLLSFSSVADNKDLIEKFNYYKNSDWEATKIGDSLFLYLFMNQNKDVKIIDSLADEFITFSEKLNNTYAIGKSNLFKSFYYSNNIGNKIKAEKYGKIAIDNLSKEEPGIDLCFAYQVYSGVLRNLEKTDLSVEYIKKGLEIAEKIDNKVLMGNSYSAIGLHYTKKGDFDKALLNYRKRLEITKATNDQSGMQATYTNIGIAFKNLNELDSSIVYHQKSLELAKTMDDDFAIAFVYNDLGATYFYKKEYQKAIKYFLKSVEIREKINEIGELAFTYSYLGQIHEELNNFNESIRWFQKAKEATSISGNKDARIKILKEISDLYAHYNKYDSAYFYFGEYQNISDSIKNNNNEIALESMIAQYEFDKKEKEIELLNREKTINNLKLKNQNFYFAILALGTFTLLIILFLALRSKKISNEKLKIESQLKEFELKKEAEEKVFKVRTSISKELHDNIGANLTFMKFLLQNNVVNSGNTKNLSEIEDIANETIRELRKTVWLINKSEINLEEFCFKIKDYFKYLNSVQIHFNISENTNISSSKATEVFRIIQEAVNNAIKHSESEKIEIYIDKFVEMLSIKIIDFGKGFDQKGVADGFGLKNIKYRADELDAKCSIKSTIGEGTTVSLQIDIT